MAQTRFIPISLQLDLGDAKAKIADLRNELASVVKSAGKQSAGGRGSQSFSGLFENAGSEAVSRWVNSEKQAQALTKRLGESTLAAVGFASVLTLTAGGLAALAANTAREEAALLNLSRQSGATVETLSTLEAAGRFSGLSLDQINEPLTKLQLNLGHARRGNKDLAAEFKALGVDIKGPVDSAFTQIVKRLGETSDQAKSATVLSKLFGEEGVKLSRVITVTGGDLDKFKEQMRNYGIVVDTEAAQKSKNLADDLVRLELRFKGIAKTVGEETIPAVKGLFATFDAIKVDPKGFFKDLLVDIGTFGYAKEKFAATGARIATAASEAEIPVPPANQPTLKLPGEGKGGTLSDTQKLRKELAGINKELKVFTDVSSTDFKLQIELGDKRTLKSQIDEIIRLRRELGQDQAAGFATQTVELSKGKFKEVLDPQGIQAQLDYLRQFKKEGEETARTVEKLGDLLIRNASVKLVPTLPASVTDEIKASAALDELLADAQARVNATTLEGQLVTSGYYKTLLKTNEEKARSYQLSAQNFDALQREAKAQEYLTGRTADLREQLASLQDGRAEAAERRRLVREGIDPTSQQGQELVGLARQVDEYGKAIEESRRRTEAFRNTVQSLFDSLLDSPKRALDQLIGLGKRFASDFLTNLTLGNRSGQQASAGGGFSLRNLLNFGGGGNGGGGLLGGLLGPGGTATFNPASAGGVGGFKGALNAALGIGLFKAPAAAAGLGITSAIPGATGALSTVTAAQAGIAGFGLSTSTAAATAAGAGGTAAAAGGSTGLLSSLGALASNPITIAAAAAIGGFLAFRYFKNRGSYERDVKKAIKAEYGIEASKDIVKQIQAIGQSKFGKDYKKRIPETIRSTEARDLLAEYASDSGQKGNAKLFDAREFSDQFSSSNFFRNPQPIDNYTPSAGSTGFVRTQATGVSGGNAPILQAAQFGVLSQLNETLRAFVDTYKPVDSNTIIAANVDAVGNAFKEAFANDPSISNQIGLSVNP